MTPRMSVRYVRYRLRSLSVGAGRAVARRLLSRPAYGAVRSGRLTYPPRAQVRSKPTRPSTVGPRSDPSAFNFWSIHDHGLRLAARPNARYRRSCPLPFRFISSCRPRCISGEMAVRALRTVREQPSGPCCVLSGGGVTDRRCFGWKFRHVLLVAPEGNYRGSVMRALRRKADR